MEKKQKKDLQRHSMTITESMIPIITTTDLLKAKPITEQLLTFGRNEVNKEISKAVTKCLKGLNIEIDNTSLQIFIEDLVDVYKWDSIEDIQICLKNGRQGKYGKTYNKLNMIVFGEWMPQHLEQKAIERESQYKSHKHEFETKEDYLKAVKEGIKCQKIEDDALEISKNEIHKDNNEFAKIRAKHQGNSFGTIEPEK